MLLTAENDKLKTRLKKLLETPPAEEAKPEDKYDIGSNL